MEAIINELKELVTRVEDLEKFSHAYLLSFEESTELAQKQGQIYKLIKEIQC